jgi:hypothetical protein
MKKCEFGAPIRQKVIVDLTAEGSLPENYQFRLIEGRVVFSDREK